jgi:hypothetical protein
MKPLDIDRARDGEVMLAFRNNWRAVRMVQGGPRQRSRPSPWITQSKTTGSARLHNRISALPKMIHTWKCANSQSFREMSAREAR